MFLEQRSRIWEIIQDFVIELNMTKGILINRRGLELRDEVFFISKVAYIERDERGDTHKNLTDLKTCRRRRLVHVGHVVQHSAL